MKNAEKNETKYRISCIACVISSVASSAIAGLSSICITSGIRSSSGVVTRSMSSSMPCNRSFACTTINTIPPIRQTIAKSPLFGRENTVRNRNENTIAVMTSVPLGRSSV